MSEREMSLDQSRHNWSLSHKLVRGLWMVVWSVCRRGPRFLSPFRIALLRLFGARIGSEVLVCGNVRVLMPWNLTIADSTAISEGVDIYNFAQVRIGSGTVVSQRVWLCTGSHDYNDPTFPLIWKDISIGDATWIAAESFVAPGVRIGDGVVVAARSVVTRHLENWNVYGGNPCVLIKPRAKPSTLKAREPDAAPG
jgi:putative colanic acid biosynthesis acetyltransferase WcaF